VKYAGLAWPNQPRRAATSEATHRIAWFLMPVARPPSRRSSGPKGHSTKQTHPLSNCNRPARKLTARKLHARPPRTPTAMGLVPTCIATCAPSANAACALPPSAQREACCSTERMAPTHLRRLRQHVGPEQAARARGPHLMPSRLVAPASVPHPRNLRALRRFRSAKPRLKPRLG